MWGTRHVPLVRCIQRIVHQTLWWWELVFAFWARDSSSAGVFLLLQNTLRTHSCLPQHIKQSSCGACQTPVTNCDYEWHCGDPGVAVARPRKHTRKAYSLSFAGSHARTHTTPTRLLTRPNFRADTRWTLWHVIWLLWRAASSVCSRKLQLWHVRAAHMHMHKTPSRPFIYPFDFFSHSCEGSHSGSVSDLCLVITQIRGQGAA